MADLTVDDLDMDDAPTTPEEWEALTVTDDETLTRILRWYRAVERRRAAQGALYQREIDRLEVKASEADAPLREQAQRLERAAQMYALGRRAASGDKLKRFPTPFGFVKTQGGGAGRWEQADPKALLEWAQEAHPEFVKVSDPEFKLADAKRVLKAQDDGTVVDPASGEVVPGLKAHTSDVTASVVLDDV